MPSTSSRNHSCSLKSRVLHTSRQHVPLSSRRVGGTSNAASLQEDAKRFAADTKRKVEAFIDEQQLRKKADKASKKASEQMRNFSDSAQSSARHTYQSLDSEYQIGDKAEKYTRRAKEAAKDIDQKYSVSDQTGVVQACCYNVFRQLRKFS